MTVILDITLYYIFVYFCRKPLAMPVVNLPVKPYVKKYLEDNCGSPAKLNSLPNLHRFFNILLERPIFRRDKEINFGHYSENIEIHISEDTFYRYGWELSKTNIISFNKEVEDLVKAQSRSYIGIYAALGIHVHKCIRNFQEATGYSEDIYPFATIKKDFQRNCTENPKESYKDLRQLIDKIFMDSLSLKRDIVL